MLPAIRRPWHHDSVCVGSQGQVLTSPYICFTSRALPAMRHWCNIISSIMAVITQTRLIQYSDIILLVTLMYYYESCFVSQSISWASKRSSFCPPLALRSSQTWSHGMRSCHSRWVTLTPRTWPWLSRGYSITQTRPSRWTTSPLTSSTRDRSCCSTSQRSRRLVRECRAASVFQTRGECTIHSRLHHSCRDVHRISYYNIPVFIYLVKKDNTCIKMSVLCRCGAAMWQRRGHGHTCPGPAGVSPWEAAGVGPGRGAAQETSGAVCPIEAFASRSETGMCWKKKRTRRSEGETTILYSLMLQQIVWRCWKGCGMFCLYITMGKWLASCQQSVFLHVFFSSPCSFICV